MARFCRAGLRFPSMGSGAEFLSFVMGLVVLWSGVGLSAQQELPAPEEPIHTLHVYTNLIQIPTLVLGPNRERLTKPIAENRFSVSIDSGPKFRATHVRLEGDDAISLSILLDVSETPPTCCRRSMMQSPILRHYLCIQRTIFRFMFWTVLCSGL